MNSGNKAGRPKAVADDTEAPAQRRPGRPRMKDSLPADPNDNSRRSRMRLAQRSYRNRKENELATTKARADALQKALNSSLDEFIKFHEMLSGKERDLPSEFMQQLNKTATNIISIARSAQADEWPADDDDRANILLATMNGDEPSDCKDDAIYIVTQVSKSSNSNMPSFRPKPATISQRIMRACVDRAADRLKLPSPPIMCLLPALLLPLQFDNREGLLSRTMRYLTIDDAEVQLDQEQNAMAFRQLPKMLRLVEGESNSLVVRIPPPNLQRLEFGRTRTIISTAMPDLQGEWLEASDVEEYLEQRGIFIRQEAPNAEMLSLAIPVDGGLSSQTTDFNETNVSTSEIQHHANIDPTVYPSNPNLELSIDYTVFGHPRDVQILPSGNTAFTPAPWSIEEADILPMDMTMRNPDHINIMINLDNLIRQLAAKCVCLGPCPGIRKGQIDEAIRDSVVQMPEL
ncbi:hypothetical protein ACHAQJ_004225 [Trichoderma viride]